jgi:tetratricopeptide (TPR) repeat protein
LAVRLLFVFIAVCVLLLGAFAWQLVSRRSADAPRSASSSLYLPGGAELVTTESGPPGARSPGADAAPADAVAPPDVQPAEPPADAASAATKPRPLSSGIRWAGETTGAAARRRLAATREKLRDEPDHEGALRDELAALVELSRWPEALETVTRLAALHPEDGRLRFEKGALLIRARRWVEAVADLKAVVEQEPTHAPAWFNLAVAHQALGHLADARRAWDRALELAPSAAAYAGRGEVLLDLREWSTAAADFEKVLRAEPENAAAVMNLALALENLGRAAEARRRLLDRLERHPRDVPTLNRLAEMAWRAFQAAPVADKRVLRDEAVDWCRRSLEVDSGQPAVRDLLEAALRADVTGK